MGQACLFLSCRPVLTGLLSASVPPSQPSASHFCVHRDITLNGAAPRADAGPEGAAGNEGEESGAKFPDFLAQLLGKHPATAWLMGCLL